MENHTKKMLQVNHRFFQWAMASFLCQKSRWTAASNTGPWPMSRKTPPFDHPRLAGQSDWIHPEVILGDVPYQKIGLSSGYPLAILRSYIYIIYNYNLYFLPMSLIVLVGCRLTFRTENSCPGVVRIQLNGQPAWS